MVTRLFSVFQGGKPSCRLIIASVFLQKQLLADDMPVVGALIGGLFDTAQMNAVIDYADIFYNKRYLFEKDVRINMLVNGGTNDIIEVNPEDIVEVDSDE